MKLSVGSGMIEELPPVNIRFINSDALESVRVRRFLLLYKWLSFIYSSAPMDEFFETNLNTSQQLAKFFLTSRT